MSVKNHRSSLLLSFLIAVAICIPSHFSNGPTAFAEDDIHPLLRHDIQTIDAEGNAREALLKIRDFCNGIDTKEFRALTDQVVYESLGESLPGPDFEGEIRAFLTANGDPLPLIVEGAKGKCLVLTDLKEQIDVLLPLTWLRRYLELQDRVETDVARSVARWKGLFELGLLFSREGSNTPQFFCHETELFALRRMNNLANRDSTPIALIESMLRTVQQPAYTDGFAAAAIRLEFQLLRQQIIDELPDNDDPQKAVASLVYHLRPKAKSEWVDAINRQVDERERLILKLLEGHGAPISKRDTLELASSIYLEALANLSAPWKEQTWSVRGDLQKEAASWSEALSAKTIDALPLILLHEQESVSDDALATARKRIEEMRNPLGKHLVSENDPATIVQMHFFSRTSLQGRRTMLALRLHERRHGKLPESLDVLVESGLLAAPPTDPYGDLLHYSPERRIVWSNGPDGVDHGGIPQREDARAIYELMRKMRPVGAPEPMEPEKDDAPVGEDVVWAIDMIDRE
jgi:hypothetical protein